MHEHDLCNPEFTRHSRGSVSRRIMTTNVKYVPLMLQITNYRNAPFVKTIIIGGTTTYSIFISSHVGFTSLAASATEHPFSAAVSPAASVTGTASSRAVTGFDTSSDRGTFGISHVSSFSSFFGSFFTSLTSFAASSPFNPCLSTCSVTGFDTSSGRGTFGISHVSSFTSFFDSFVTSLTGSATSSARGISGISHFSPASSFAFSSSFSPSCISTSSFSFLSFFADVDFLRFLTGSGSAGGGVDFAFSLIRVDLRGVSPLPQSNSEILGPPGCDFRYCSNCFLFVISSPVGAVNTVSFFFGVPPFFSTNYT
ncbi:hypothetical protein HanXRQr2_Chr12g0524041 [Helianthus annuus]|uniref:Uncharacterized protein n=1 Tax=Helianthus annuus TaxID=4232 RepID=A0A9K3EN89_HELAN|nr:hypothetical protein HanXRQr2_Chr12g0524041 [Helianthus annuus]